MCNCQNQSWSTEINLFQRCKNKIYGYNISGLKYTWIQQGIWWDSTKQFWEVGEYKLDCGLEDR